MQGKPFYKLSTDEDTRIISRTIENIEGYDVLLEKWSWEGVLGYSAIIPENQIASLSDEQIQDILLKNLDITGKTTFSRKSDYVFLNYGFETF